MLSQRVWSLSHMFVHSEDIFGSFDLIKWSSVIRNPTACHIAPLHFTFNLLQHRSLGRDRIREHTKEQSIKMSVNIADKIEVEVKIEKNGNYELMNNLYVEKERREETFCKANTIRYNKSNSHITTSYLWFSLSLSLSLQLWYSCIPQLREIDKIERKRETSTRLV